MKRLMLAVSLLAATNIINAAEQAEYNVEEYCKLVGESNSVYGERHSRAYAKKLGQVPSNRQCIKIIKALNLAKGHTSPSWDYRFNKPYKGSTRRLSLKQIDKLKMTDEKIW